MIWPPGPPATTQTEALAKDAGSADNSKGRVSGRGPRDPRFRQGCLDPCPARGAEAVAAGRLLGHRPPTSQVGLPPLLSIMLLCVAPLGPPRPGHIDSNQPRGSDSLGAHGEVLERGVRHSSLCARDFDRIFSWVCGALWGSRVCARVSCVSPVWACLRACD